MKARILTIGVALLFAFLGGCEQENDFERDYARITSSKIESITVNGVLASASFEESFLNKVSDHGFVWGETATLVADHHLTSHNGIPKSASFQVSIQTDLLPNKKYFARAFVVVGDKTTYGELLSFTSLGSKGPTIESVSPLKLVPGSEVTVTGTGFGSSSITTVQVLGMQGNNKVAKDATIKSITDTEIVFYYPKDVLDQGQVVVRRNENAAVFSTEKIEIVKPVFTRISAKDYCSNVVIKANNLLAMGMPNYVYVNNLFVGNSAIKGDSIVVDRQFHRPLINVKIVYLRNDYEVYSISAELTNTAAWPVVTGTLPTEIPYNDEFVLEGFNFPTCGIFNVRTEGQGDFEGPAVEITGVTPTQVSFKLVSQACSDFTVSIFFNEGEIYRSNVISRKPFTITSMTPVQGTLGTEITVVGENLEHASLVFLKQLYYGYLPLEMISRTNNELKAKIVRGNYNNMGTMFPASNQTIAIRNCNSDANVKSFELTLPEITITDVTPNPATALQPVVIKGTNFTVDPVLRIFLKRGIYEIELFPSTLTDTEITTYPIGTLKGSGQATLSIIHFEKRFEYAQKITLNQ